MNCRVQVSDATGSQVSYLVERYGLTLDSFLRGCLDFAVLVMPLQVPTVVPVAVPTKPAEPVEPLVPGGPNDGDDDAEEPKAVVPTPPQFSDEFMRAVLPAYALRVEFHRVSAMVEDSILSLRANRLQTEMIRRGEGLTPGQAVADKRVFPRIASPVTSFREDQQQATVSALRVLSQPGIGGSMRRLPVLAGVLDLNSTTSQEEAQRGMSVTRVDMILHLPLLKRYGFVPETMVIGDRLGSDDAEVIVAGFSALFTQLVPAVCFLFTINQSLPGEDFRQDLFIIQHLGKTLARALETELLAAEAALHLFNGTAEFMTEKLLILASHAKPMQPIFGPEDAVPAVAANRSARAKDLKLQGSVKPRTVGAPADDAGYKAEFA